MRPRECEYFGKCDYLSDVLLIWVIDGFCIWNWDFGIEAERQDLIIVDENDEDKMVTLELISEKHSDYKDSIFTVFLTFL